MSGALAIESIGEELQSSIDVAERMVLSLLTAAEARDFRMRRHAERVAKYCLEIADHLELSENERQQLHYGALLHDIGNIGIPDSILLKPGGLTEMEFEEMKLHPIIGVQICESLPFIEAIRPLIRNHHEKLDGSGYPDGLYGDEIPLLVRILSVTDVYDSLRSDRAYRSAFGHDEALEILRDEAQRGWWDAEIAELLAEVTAPESDFVPV
ncbi:MAG: HD-GYP domain-containing protein [Armatimonadota bacterium]|nr:HD-GYP domain-containing protein [Armatimonadota bacterium]